MLRDDIYKLHTTFLNVTKFVVYFVIVIEP